MLPLAKELLSQYSLQLFKVRRTIIHYKNTLNWDSRVLGVTYKSSLRENLWNWTPFAAGPLSQQDTTHRAPNTSAPGSENLTDEKESTPTNNFFFFSFLKRVSCWLKIRLLTPGRQLPRCWKKKQKTKHWDKTFQKLSQTSWYWADLVLQFGARRAPPLTRFCLRH